MFQYRIDESRWPLAIFESPGNKPNSEVDADSFYRELERLLARGERFATLHDISGMVPDPARRKRFTSWVGERFALLQKRLVAHAVVIDSAVHRHVLTAVFWMVDKPCPLEVFTSRKEAEAWLLEELRRAGVSRRSAAPPSSRLTE